MEEERKNRLNEFLKLSYNFLFAHFGIIYKELKGCKTVLDLGCGKDSPIKYCKVPYSLGVELFEPYLRESQSKGIHSEYLHEDILKVEFEPQSFEAVICIEVLEHLTKEEGYKLIKKMENWASKKVIITTPNDFVWQDAIDNNKLQEHKSGWTTEEFKELGYIVYGTGGWKLLRGYLGSIKYKPKLLWATISSLTQIITFWFPKHSFQLLAVKRFCVKK